MCHLSVKLICKSGEKYLFQNCIVLLGRWTFEELNDTFIHGAKCEEVTCVQLNIVMLLDEEVANCRSSRLKLSTMFLFCVASWNNLPSVEYISWVMYISHVAVTKKCPCTVSKTEYYSYASI